MPVALLTNYLTGYRMPLYALLAERYGVEVLLFGGGDRYVPAWFSDLDAQIAAAPFPAERLLGGPRGAFNAAASGRYRAVIAPFAGGTVLPAAFLGTRVRRVPFVLWASVWAEPRSGAHLAGRPLVHGIYRHAEAVVAYGEHVRRFVAGIRGRDGDVFVAPQAVEPELFGRVVTEAETAAARARWSLGDGPIVLFTGRLVEAKGVAVLLDAWAHSSLDRWARAPSGSGAQLVVAGDGPLSGAVAAAAARDRSIVALGPVPRDELPALYASAACAAVPSVPTPRFLEPWGLVVNEAMHAGTPVIATDAVGAAAGGLVRDGATGLVVPAGDPRPLAGAVARLLGEPELRERLGAAGRSAVAAHTPEAMADAFGRALAAAEVSCRGRRAPRGRGG